MKEKRYITLTPGGVGPSIQRDSKWRSFPSWPADLQRVHQVLQKPKVEFWKVRHHLDSHLPHFRPIQGSGQPAGSHFIDRKAPRQNGMWLLLTLSLPLSSFFLSPSLILLLILPSPYLQSYSFSLLFRSPVFNLFISHRLLYMNRHSKQQYLWRSAYSMVRVVFGWSIR